MVNRVEFAARSAAALNASTLAVFAGVGEPAADGVPLFLPLPHAAKDIQTTASTGNTRMWIRISSSRRAGRRLVSVNETSPNRRPPPFPCRYN